MMIAPIALSYIAATSDLAKIVDVQTTSYRAGKLGRRVQTLLTVERNGVRFVTSAPSYHTHVGGVKPREYHVGDMVRVVRFPF